MAIDDLKEKLSKAFDPKTVDAINQYKEKLSLLSNTIDKGAKSIEQYGNAVKIMGQGIDGQGDGLEKFNNLINDIAFNGGKFFETFSNEAAGAFIALLTSFTETNEALGNMGKALDANIQPLQALREEMYDLGNQFGMTFDESKKITEELGNIVDNTPDDLLISFTDLKDITKEAANSFSGLGLTLDKLNEQINTGAGTFNSLNAAILLARRSGESNREIMQSLNKAITRQGTSLEGAITQYSQFIDLAQETGTTVDFVRQTLEGAVGNFNKLGMSADFARPMLDGFTKSLEKTNLGIANARGLVSTLTNAFGSIATSYDKAFIMSQVGGLNTGGAGGGVLSPSIQLRQRMRDAKETGSQAEIGLEMAEALKQTIERFGGGEIITLEDAARDPSKANLFKIQEDLLGQYGISGESAANTLDMLKELSSVTLSGNEELKNSLGEQLADQLDKQDENTLYQDRIAKSSENIFASSVLTNKYLDKLVDLSLGAGKTIAGGQATAMRTTFNLGDMMVKETGSLVEEFRSDAKKQLDLLSQKSLAVQNARLENPSSAGNVDFQNRIIDMTQQSLSNATYNITASFQNGTFSSSSSSVNSHADPVPLPPLVQ